MIGIVDGSERIRLASPRYFAGERYEGAHKLVPAMLGVVLPVSLPVMAMPSLIAAALPFMYVVMIAIALLAVGIAVYSTVRKGEVVSVTLEPRSCSLRLVHAGLFANATSRLALDRVASLDMVAMQFERRRSAHVPQLVTTSGRVYTLPDDITRSELAAFRSAIADARKKQCRRAA